MIKINKYEYLVGDEILPPDQSKIKEQTKFTYSLFKNAFEKQTKQMKSKEKKKEKKIEEHGET